MKIAKLFQRPYASLNNQDPALNPACQQLEVNNWQISNFILKKILPIVGIHPFPLTELSIMIAAVCALKPEFIFEWGTNIGKSARIFSETVNFFQLKTTIHTIDLPNSVAHNEHPKQDRGKLVRNDERVIMHEGDGPTLALDLWQQLCPRQQPALFFLDGDHSYESVTHELAAIHTTVPSAHLLLHDTFYQSPQSGYNVGPNQALQEFLAQHGDRYTVIQTNIGLPGMTLLYQQ